MAGHYLCRGGGGGKKKGGGVRVRVRVRQACLSVVIVFLACNPSQSCYIKLCSYFCPFVFLLGLLCPVVCSFICLACLLIYIFTAMCMLHQFSWDQFILPVLFKIRFVGCSFLFIVLTRLTPYRFFILYILYCLFFSFPFSSFLGWHSLRETYVPSRITGAEFAIPWA